MLSAIRFLPVLMHVHKKKFLLAYLLFTNQRNALFRSCRTFPASGVLLSIGKPLVAALSAGGWLGLLNVFTSEI
jgi:hypothetical protein